MGARQDRVSHEKWNMNQLANATGLTPQQVSEIYQQFMQAAGPDGQLSMNEFAVFYSRLPGVQQQDPRYMQQQIPRIFRTFDRDGSGAISFDEFLGAVVMMNHDIPRADRIDFLIRENNSHHHHHKNEHIPAQYGHQVFSRLNDYYGLPPGTEHQCWKEVDVHNRGYVTHDELMNYIRQQEAYNRVYEF